MFWRLPWEGLHLVCHIRLQSFHHKSALFPTPVPLDILKKGKSRAEREQKWCHNDMNEKEGATVTPVEACRIADRRILSIAMFYT
jgi:hypothetical protein